MTTLQQEMFFNLLTAVARQIFYIPSQSLFALGIFEKHLFYMQYFLILYYVLISC